MWALPREQPALEQRARGFARLAPEWLKALVFARLAMSAIAIAAPVIDRSMTLALMYICTIPPEKFVMT